MNGDVQLLRIGMSFYHQHLHQLSEDDSWGGQLFDKCCQVLTLCWLGCRAFHRNDVRENDSADCCMWHLSSTTNWKKCGSRTQYYNVEESYRLTTPRPSRELTKIEHRVVSVLD